MRIGIYAISALALLIEHGIGYRTDRHLFPFAPLLRSECATRGRRLSGTADGPQRALLDVAVGLRSNGQLYQHWQLVNPPALDVINYRGFRTPGQ